jgi:hypothetical protein
MFCFRSQHSAGIVSFYSRKKDVTETKRALAIAGLSLALTVMSSAVVEAASSTASAAASNLADVARH